MERGITPEIARRIVLFPAVLAPMTQTYSPAVDVEVDAVQHVGLAVSGPQARDREQGCAHAIG